MKNQVFCVFFLCLSFVSLPPDIFGSGNQTEKKIQEIISRITPGLIQVRRDIHQHPELSLQEVRTSALVAEYLEKLGLKVRTGIGGNGVLGILEGRKEGPIVGMRGDMDALPITEETGLPFASKVKVMLDNQEVGVMHACGHDVHTTVLLGVAQVLSSLRDELPGTVLFIAQPAEEAGDGAKLMLEDGVFDTIKPEAMFAFHVEDTAKAGFIRYTTGFAGANCDGFNLEIHSEGCHGASPDSCVDPIVVGAQVVVALQVMIPRELNVENDTVITVGSFHAGHARNVIPQKAELKATIRSYGEKQRELVKERVTRCITNVCEAAGAPFDLDYYFGTPALYNDPKLLDEILPIASRVLGGEEYLIEKKPEMGGEDFSYFAREIPSVMLYLGVVPKDVDKTSVHSPTFIVEEESIPLGVKLMSTIILGYLDRHKSEKKPVRH